MKKLIFIITALVFAGLCLSCTKDNSINSGGGSGSGSGNSGSSSATVSLSGTTWTTGEMIGFGTLTLTFTATDCTLKRTNGSATESCTYPYTLSGNTVNTKVKLSVWSGGEEQDATGTISGTSMDFKLSKNGSNYSFSKK